MKNKIANEANQNNPKIKLAKSDRNGVLIKLSSMLKVVSSEIKPYGITEANQVIDEAQSEIIGIFKSINDPDDLELAKVFIDELKKYNLRYKRTSKTKLIDYIGSCE